MLASITPLGERGRNNRFAVTATAYVVGSAFAGAGLGAALGALGMVAHWLLGAGRQATVVALTALALLAALGIMVDVVAGGRHLPTIHHQVDERWLGRYRGWVYGGGFGCQLGMGVVTIVTASATYVAFAAALLTGSWLGGLVVGCVFGLARALPTLASGRVTDPGALVRFHQWLAAAARPARLGALAAQTGVAVAAIIWALVV